MRRSWYLVKQLQSAHKSVSYSSLLINTDESAFTDCPGRSNLRQRTCVPARYSRIILRVKELSFGNCYHSHSDTRLGFEYS